MAKWVDYNNVTRESNNSFELAVNEGSSEKTSCKWIVAHSTATTNAPAKNVASYFKNNWRTSETYTQLVIDDNDCYLVGDLDFVAWGAGYTANHASPVQIELCEFTDKDRAIKAYKNFVNTLRYYAKVYDLPCELDNGTGAGIKTHNYLSRVTRETSHTDPLTYLQTIGISYEQFKNDIKNGVGNVSHETASTNSNIPAGFIKEEATFKPYYVINVREEPNTGSRVITTISNSQSVKYDSYQKIGIYTWIHLTTGGYVACREWGVNGSSPWGEFY